MARFVMFHSDIHAADKIVSVCISKQDCKHVILQKENVETHYDFSSYDAAKIAIAALFSQLQKQQEYYQHDHSTDKV